MLVALFIASVVLHQYCCELCLYVIECSFKFYYDRFAYGNHFRMDMNDDFDENGPIFFEDLMDVLPRVHHHGHQSPAAGATEHRTDTHQPAADKSASIRHQHSGGFRSAAGPYGTTLPAALEPAGAPSSADEPEGLAAAAVPGPLLDDLPLPLALTGGVHAECCRADDQDADVAPAGALLVIQVNQGRAGKAVGLSYLHYWTTS